MDDPQPVADSLVELLNPSHARQHGHSFDSTAEPIVARAGAHQVADAIANMLAARVELQAAKEHVPSYTGQWSDHDYIRDQQATYDQTCNDLLDALKSALS
jgi:hypothetical protein